MEPLPGTPTLARPPDAAFNYDAVFEDADHVLVSAASGGFGNGNQIFRVQLWAPGSTTLLAQRRPAPRARWPSTPRATCSTAPSSAAFPAAPRQPDDVLRWSAAQLTRRRRMLTSSDAVLVPVPGYEGAGSLTYRSDHAAALYLAENNFGERA